MDGVRQRMRDDLLVNVSPKFARRVTDEIGLAIQNEPTVRLHDRTSPALSMGRPAESLAGRKVAVLTAEGSDAARVTLLMKKLKAVGANAESVPYDAVFVPGWAGARVAKLGLFVRRVSEAFVHGKPIAAVGDGAAVLANTGVYADKAATAVDGLINTMHHHRVSRRGKEAVPA